MTKFEELQALLEALRPDFEKFYDKGNGSAGTRIRKGLNELKKKAQEARIEVQARKSALNEEKKAAKNS